MSDPLQDLLDFQEQTINDDYMKKIVKNAVGYNFLQTGELTFDSSQGDLSVTEGKPFYRVRYCTTCKVFFAEDGPHYWTHDGRKIPEHHDMFDLWKIGRMSNVKVACPGPSGYVIQVATPKEVNGIMDMEPIGRLPLIAKAKERIQNKRDLCDPQGHLYVKRYNDGMGICTHCEELVEQLVVCQRCKVMLYWTDPYNEVFYKGIQLCGECSE